MNLDKPHFDSPAGFASGFELVPCDTGAIRRTFQDNGLFYGQPGSSPLAGHSGEERYLNTVHFGFGQKQQGNRLFTNQMEHWARL
jgi:hypothetical protein